MQVDIDRLWKYHEDGKLRHGSHPDRNLHVWCYSQATVYNRDWDDLTRLCRGLVTDEQGTIVSRPFPKFFNWGEPEAPTAQDHVNFVAYDKLDGSLIVAGLDADGETVVSTKGSFNTWHSEAAREMLTGVKPSPGTTAIFEFIDPKNRIVVDYKDFSGLVLLGSTGTETGLDYYDPDVYADEIGWSGEIVTRRKINLLNTLNTVQDPEAGVNREGFVLVYPEYENGPSARVKIKFAQYVNLHRMLSRLNNVAVWEALMGGTFEALLEAVPDELYDKVRECSDELNAKHLDVVTGARANAATAQKQWETRREQAAWVTTTEHANLTFKVLDGRDITTLAWASIKPELDREWAFLR